MRKIKIAPVPIDNHNAENMTINSQTVLDNQPHISEIPFKQ
jgi:hypothetical protein